MTARQLYDAVLVELNKVESASLLLDDFVYLLNKAVNNYVNKRYNLYAINQQLDDDLRVLSGTALLDDNVTAFTTPYLGSAPQNATITAKLPDDYFHLLNCIVEFQRTIPLTGACATSSNNVIQSPARRLTADMFSQVMNNYYLKPSVKRPYFYLHQKDIVVRTNQVGVSDETLQAGDRVGNASDVLIEVRFGKDGLIYQAKKIYIDYLKVPQHIDLTHDQLESSEDTSQTIEFPAYVCYEIINELVALVLENIGDPRLNTNIPINHTIGTPQAGTRSK